MNENLSQIIASLHKPQIRNAIRLIASELLSFLDSTEPSSVPVADIQSTTIIPPTPLKDPLALRPTVTFKLGGSDSIQVQIKDAATGSTIREETRELPTVKEQGYDYQYTDNVEADLPLIIQRCRLKAKATLFAMRRRTDVAEGVDFKNYAEEHYSLIGSAKSLGACFLWMVEPYMLLPDDKQMQMLAGLYETLALAAETAQELENSRSSNLLSAMQLLAEAQSALRQHIADIDRRNDQDQNDTFRWLRKTITSMNTFISRYMTLDDVADPSQWENLQSRILNMKESTGVQKRAERDRRNLLNKIKYHSKRILAGGSATNDWENITSSVETLIGGGLPLSNVELRDLLTPLVDLIPFGRNLGNGMMAVLGEINKFTEITADIEAETESQEDTSAETPAVEQVANLLRGKRLLLVGGTRRPKSQEALKVAFGLEELMWPTTKKHEHISTFASDASRADLVLMAIRWSSHSFEDVKGICSPRGIPFVRLKAGYNPKQVAQAILEQAGDALARTA